MRSSEESGRELERLDRPFKVVAFDWDATAGSGRPPGVRPVCQLLERLLARGLAAVVVTDGNLAGAVGELSPIVAGPNNRALFIAANGGAEVYGFDGRPRPVPLWRRAATPDEERRLTEVADALSERLRARGLEVRVVRDRLHRRKVDLIPSPAWQDPPKGAVGALLAAVQARLLAAGLAGLGAVLEMAAALARERGLPGARVATDVKHVEVALTDKSDAVDWMMREVCGPRGARPEEVLIAGAEFGPVGGAEGTDRRMLTEASRGAVFVSVGPEPGGVEPPVLHLGGGPERFAELLAALADRLEGEPRAPLGLSPELLPMRRTDDSRWLLTEEGVDLTRERQIESLFAVANGYTGTRASLAEAQLAASSPGTFVAGVFDALAHPGAVPELAVAPDWTRLRVRVEGREIRLDPATCIEHRRTLDLRQGVSWREFRHRDADGRQTLLRGLRLASLADRHLLFQCLAVTAENYSGRIEVELALEPARRAAAAPDRPRLEPVSARSDGRPGADREALLFAAPGVGTTVAFAPASRALGPAPLDAGRALPGAPAERADGSLIERWSLSAQVGDGFRLDRTVAVFTSRDGERPAPRAAERVAYAFHAGAQALADAHRAAWEERWRRSDVGLEGDDELQRALRFAIYHLVSAANPEDERVSIGARTLTGDSYKGHVFWDTDIFMVPFFTFTDPPSARALLMYRFHTLDGAREKARDLGYRGALYPWESADTGREVTPRFMTAPDGEVVRVLSGLQEHHISADVAFAVWQYWKATGDDGFFAEAGAEILLETARFWASRGAFESDGKFHLRELIGPDEYHEGVGDNAFTNGLAQVNLERGAEALEVLGRRFPSKARELRERLQLSDEEVAQWRSIARAMDLGLEPATGLIEQFEGYFGLEDYDLAPMRARGARAAPMDLLLGRERVQASKVVKQADVVMLIALLWDRIPARARRVNFDYYEPRTCHGSSLSPAAHAWVAARLGEMATAGQYFRQAAEIDLSNSMGNAAGGVHAAALGGLWQAAVFGFGGVRQVGEGIGVAPRLLEGWSSLSFPLAFRGARLRFEIEPSALRVQFLEGPGEARLPLTLGDDGGAPVELRLGEVLEAVREGAGWRQVAQRRAPEGGDHERP